MAVKRSEKNTQENAVNTVQVEVPNLEHTDPAAEEVQTEETMEGTAVTTSDSGEETTVTEDTTPTEGDTPVETETPDHSGVTVDPESLNVKEDNIPEPPEAKVRIRMRVDHHCVIAMERYDFKAGQTYLVPPNVKRIMNKQGYLAPL